MNLITSPSKSTGRNFPVTSTEVNAVIININLIEKRIATLEEENEKLKNKIIELESKYNDLSNAKTNKKQIKEND